MLRRPGPSAAATAIARKIGGKASTTSREAHDHALDDTAGEAGERAEDGADDDRQHDHGGRGRQRIAGAVERPDEDVTAERVGAQQLRCVRRREPFPDGLAGPGPRPQRNRDRHHDPEQQHATADGDGPRTQRPANRGPRAGVGGSDEVLDVEGVLDGAHEYLIFGSAAA